MADKPQVEGLKSAADLAKQLITLSTAMVGLTITFLEKIVEPIAAGGVRHVPCLLQLAWGGFGLTILFSCLTLMGITGTLNALDRKANGLPLNTQQEKSVDAYGQNITLFAILMICAFLAALVLTMVASARKF